MRLLGILPNAPAIKMLAIATVIVAVFIWFNRKPKKHRFAFSPVITTPSFIKDGIRYVFDPDDLPDWVMDQPEYWA